MRPRCEGCERPCTACLCPAMPKDRLLPQRTSVIIMQHPLETKQKLATVPVLAKCLDCEVLVGRRFRKGCSLRLDQLLEAGKHKVLLLFPCREATDLSSWHAQELGQEIPDKELVLLTVDATWQHAKEMVKASMPYLKDFVTPVSLPFDKSKEGLGLGGKSDLILRKEPYDGFLSTMEAVAHALGVLEPDGDQIEQALLAVLHRMVSLQAAHLPSKKQNEVELEHSAPPA